MKEKISYLNSLEIDKTTCWYDLNVEMCIQLMGKGLYKEYGRRLKKLVTMIPKDAKTIIDIGCGSGRSVMLFENYEYTGIDLPKVIETISKVVNPDLRFIKCDIIEDDIKFISKYDIVHMDAFIDSMQYPLQILDKILKNCSKYVLLFRQEIIDKETKVIKNPSYNGFTYHSLINRKSLLEVLGKYNFEILKEMDAGFGENWKIFLLKK